MSFQFNAAHQLTFISRSNGVMTQYTYDQDGRVVSITDTSNGAVLVSIHLTRDAIGRVTSANRILPQEATPGAPGTLPLGFNGANQIAGFTYDARGRLISGDEGSTYTWNSASRLVSYTRSDGSAACTYDGLGQRVSRTGADGTTVNYVLNYATGLPSIAVVQSANSDVTYYVYAPDGSLLYGIDAATGSHHFYAFDETGSTTLLTDDSGAVTDTYGISSYGDVVTAGASNKTNNPFTWQGQWGVMQEPGTGLFYVRFRYYDSAFGRFLSRDPMFSPAPLEINSYQYAAGNPVANGDPMGLKNTNLGAVPLGTAVTPGETDYRFRGSRVIGQVRLGNRVVTEISTPSAVAAYGGYGFNGGNYFVVAFSLAALFGITDDYFMGGFATVDPPTLQIDDGPLPPPAHSVVNDVSSVILP